MTYKEAYERLQFIVEKIENNDVDVDKLVDYLKEAEKLYDFCMSKLKEAKKTLEDFDLKDEDE